MIIRLKSLNGSYKACGCGGDEFRLSGFRAETAGKHYQHLLFLLVCDACEESYKVRTGKVRDVEVVVR